MRTGENTSAVKPPSSFETSSQPDAKDETRRARARASESGQPSGQVAASDTRVFEEATSKLSSSIDQSVPLHERTRAQSSSGLSDAPSTTSLEPSGHSAHAADADSEVSALPFPADFRATFTDLVTGDTSSGEGVEAQLISDGSIEDVPDLEAGSDALDAAEPGAAGRSDADDTGDQVISLSARAASALAAGTALAPFGAIALGGASNMADFLAPAVVDGIENPLTRSVAAAGFSGVFLGLTASVTAAIGNDLAERITDNRIAPTAPQGDVSRRAQLWSAVKNQTIPAFVGFAAGFVTANALDADSGKLGDTELNAETVLLKLGRATAGGVGLGLMQEAAKTFSDHSLTRTEAGRVFENTRSLGEAIKRNVTSLPQAMSAYTRPTEKGGATELGNVLGAAFGFATYAAIYGVVSNALQNAYGEKTGERLSEPDAQAAIATAAGVAGFVIADQLTRNIYANVMPVREIPGADEGDVDIPEMVSATGLDEPETPSPDRESDFQSDRVSL